jgi:tetratricopeptide (TPR) repeat protein
MHAAYGNRVINVKDGGMANEESQCCAFTVRSNYILEDSTMAVRLTKDNPLCFVLMPFGRKKDPNGGPDIDFDPIYEQAIKPAIEAAGMEPVRADEERTGGIIHKPMFERLLLCDFAVADLTTGNPNVFYELGVRHAARPATTLAIFAKNQNLPFDIGFLRALPYDLAESNAFTSREAGLLQNALTKRLMTLRTIAREDAAPDSPLFQLLTDYGAPDIARLKTDVFRDRVRYSNERKRALANARMRGDVEEMVEIESRLGDLDGIEIGVIVDLFLSYRAVQAWDRMIALYDHIPVSLQHTTMMREQYGLALNRAGRWQEAVAVLERVVDEKGPSSETLGILGRVYKGMWVQAEQADNTSLARGYLQRAIDSYVRGFEADWRDTYPGINAVTLLDIDGSATSLQKKDELLPVVQFAVKQRLKASKPDYWDYATLLELAVLATDEAVAQDWLSQALANVREVWEPETTANNLKLIQTARQKRGLKEPWLDEIIAMLESPDRLRENWRSV